MDDKVRLDNLCGKYRQSYINIYITYLIFRAQAKYLNVTKNKTDVHCCI